MVTKQNPDTVHGHIEIPETIDDCFLWAIDAKAFKDCKGLESVEIPRGFLGHEAFADCTNLKKAVINCSDDNVLIEDKCFKNCTSLRVVTLNSIEHIFAEAFSGCKALESIVLPESLKSLGHNCFECCTNLKAIQASKKLTNIAPTCFNNASSSLTTYCPENSTIAKHCQAIGITYRTNESMPSRFLYETSMLAIFLKENEQVPTYPPFREQNENINIRTGSNSSPIR